LYSQAFFAGFLNFFEKCQNILKSGFFAAFCTLTAARDKIRAA